jgi:hypothetical protein
LRLKTAMIDARIDVEFGQPLIGMLSPALAPFLQQVSTIPVAVLLAEAVLVDITRGEHHMGMRLGLAVRVDIPMHIQVGDHPARDELPLNEVARQPNALDLVQLARDRELHFPRELRVLA